MIYWVTGAINASFWPYYARREEMRIEVPTAYAAIPRETVRPPHPWAERVYNIQRWTPMPAGSHFAALEEPKALAAELRAFFRGLR
jgi:pimeloyl-ACP methyl ester carboxylesterase